MSLLARTLAEYNDYIVTTLSLLVYVLTIHKSRWAFIVGMGNQFFWGQLGMSTHKYGLVISACIFFCVNVYGLVKWTRNPPITHGEFCLCDCGNTPTREAVTPWAKIVRLTSDWLMSGQRPGTVSSFRNLKYWWVR